MQLFQNFSVTKTCSSDNFLSFSVYIAAKFLSQAILQNDLQLSIVSSQIIANNLILISVFP